MKTLLSTRDVAELMKVTETTIKRWSADGDLPCVKTPGGHRRYRMPDVLRFAEDRRYPLSGVRPPVMVGVDSDMLEFGVFKRDFRTISRLLLERALKGERAEILELLTYLVKHQVSIASLGDDVVRPALAEIGRLWTAGQIEIDHEHVASQALLEAIIRLSPDLPRKPDNGWTALCACAEGDHHEIGLRILCYALESEGWRVHYLGANTPFNTLRSRIATARPRLVCLSMSVPASATTLRELRSVGELARSLDAAFLLGGTSADALPADEILCDGVPSSVNAAIAIVRERFQPSTRAKRPPAAPKTGGTR